MVYVLIRRSFLLDRRLLTQTNICGCCSVIDHKYKHTFSGTRQIRHIYPHGSRRHRFFKPFPVYTKQYHLNLFSYVSLQGNTEIPHSYRLSHTRLYHATLRKLKDESKVEKSVKVLKEKTSEKEKTSVEEDILEKASLGSSKETQDDVAQENVSIQEKESTSVVTKETGVISRIYESVKGFIKHYVNGFKLIMLDAKICLPLLFKYIRQGRSSLRRREHKQLMRTLGDLIRMIPLIPMLLIPFGELLIPLYISFGLMPSVFMSKAKVEEKNRQKLQKKLEYSALLTQSLQNVPLHKKKDSAESSSTLKDFTEFLEKVKSTEVIPNNEEIMKFSRLFEDDFTLENLNVQQLHGLCKLLGIGFLGEIPSTRILRFQIWMKLRKLEVDDKLIMKEGIDSLTIWELQAANRARGMRALGVREDRLKFQLQQWLELHIKEKIPITLLLLSRVLYLDENLSMAEQLKQTISALSDSTVDKVKVEAAETSGEVVDSATKIKVLSEETKAILEEEQQEREELEKELLAKQEAERELERAEEMERLKKEEEEAVLTYQATTPNMQSEEKDITEDITPTPDIAKPILAGTEEEIIDQVTKDVQKDLDDITSKDLGIIEQAIEDMAKHHQDEFEEVKEDLDEYIEDVEDVRALCSDTSQDHIQESKGAKRLRRKLDKYLGKVDRMIADLQDKREQIQESMEDKEVDKEKILDAITDRKRNLISVNEVLLSLNRLQKDEVRMQKVLTVLDTDDDGLIDINDVLKVTELLGRENLKLNKAEVAAMMNLLREEEELEEQEKQLEKEEKEMIKKDNGGNGEDIGDSENSGKQEISATR